MRLDLGKRSWLFGLGKRNRRLQLQRFDLKRGGRRRGVSQLFSPGEPSRRLEEPGIGGLCQNSRLSQPRPLILHQLLLHFLPGEQDALQYGDQVRVGQHGLQYLLLLLRGLLGGVFEVLLQDLVVLQLCQPLLPLQLHHLLVVLLLQLPHLGLEGACGLARAPLQGGRGLVLRDEGAGAQHPREGGGICGRRHGFRRRMR